MASAKIIRLPRTGTLLTLPAGVEAWINAHDGIKWLGDETAVKYGQTFTVIGRRLKQNESRVVAELSYLDTPEGRADFKTAFDEAFGHRAPATRARHLSTARSAIAWWNECEWLFTDPTRGWATPKIVIDETRALTRGQVDALFRLDAPLREKTLWRMLYESVARADEILSINIEDLDLPNKRARVISKGGATDWIYWQSRTAHLLPRLIAGRKSGPVFLADRLPTKPVAAQDLCPHTGRARLSYRRAEEIFNAATKLLANPGASLDGLSKPERAKLLRGLTGWTLHQIRHSGITHDAEEGTSASMLMGRSRHKSIRSLGRYAKPSPEAIARHVATRDPSRRKR